MPGPSPEGNSNVELTVDEFGTLSDLIYRRIGIRLEPKKIFFLSKRVENRLDFTGISSPAEYIRYVRFSDGAGEEFQSLVNLLTINETYFFRDFPQLQAFAEHCLADVVERKLAARDYTLRIWSAGCSTGEEPYTISIILREMLDDVSAWDIINLASDIDNTALKKARAGIYEPRSVRDVPEQYLSKYFKKNGGETFALSDKIRNSVRFEHLNLADKPALREKRGFDFIFCRNVLIYFDDVSRKQLVDHFYIALNKGGYVFLGSSESVGRITTAFKLTRAGGYLIYCKE
jgi:chemotaxis protein methyltransferase CheR